MYTRVFTSILDSSINCSDVPPSARWLWLTMLLIGDEDGTGVVDIPVERLAARAGLSVDETRSGIAVLMSPDPLSRSAEHEGRRLLPIRENPDRGWEIVNWSRYRAIAQKEHEREATRLRVAAHRERKKVTESNGDVTKCNDAVTKCTVASPSPSPDSTPDSERENTALVLAPKRSRFVPPTYDDVAEYMSSKSFPNAAVEAVKFLAHYDSNGWKVGRNPMKSWKGAVASWILRKENP